MLRRKRNQELEDRVIAVAEYMLEHKTTVRATAQAFEVSKSTIHKDVASRLEDISPSLFKEVREVLDTNSKESAIRGGLATKDKYLRMKEEGH